jgi:hypothetical protein
MARAPLRLRLAKAILGNKAKEYIPSLNSLFDGWGYGSTGAPLNDYISMNAQLGANLGWCFAANPDHSRPTGVTRAAEWWKCLTGKRNLDC